MANITPVPLHLAITMSVPEAEMLSLSLVSLFDLCVRDDGGNDMPESVQDFGANLAAALAAIEAADGATQDAELDGDGATA